MVILMKVKNIVVPGLSRKILLPAFTLSFEGVVPYYRPILTVLMGSSQQGQSGAGFPLIVLEL